MSPRGVVLYQGPSQLDGRPVVAIATGLRRSSRNRKTGAMVQVWILPQEANPVRASRRGLDRAVCGECPLRWATAAGKGRGTCYVNLGQAPLAVWRAWRRGAYAAPSLEEAAGSLEGRAVRFGAYGDPAAVPVAVWEAVARSARRWTGYTHQWARPASQGLRALCMASCETPGQAQLARAQGWRVFLTRGTAEPVPEGFITCPASNEAGNRSSCARCGLCDGSRGPEDGRRSITILLH